MLAGFFGLFSVRGRLARGPFAIVMVALAAACAALWRMGPLDGVAGMAQLLAIVLLPWLYLAALARRLRDCGRSRAWVFLPFALALAAFAAGFLLYEAPAASENRNWGKDLLLVILLPFVGAIVSWLLVRIAAGLMAAATVWLVFTLALLIPGSRAPEAGRDGR